MQIFLLFVFSFFLLIKPSLAENLPLRDFLINQGFCDQENEPTADYISLNGRDVYGTYWKIKACQEITIDSLKDALAQKGFNIDKISQKTLWASGTYQNGKIFLRYDASDQELRLLQQIIVKAGQKIKIKLPPDEKVFFYLEHPQNKFLSMYVSFDDPRVEAKLEAYSEIKKGKLTKNVRYFKELKGKEEMRLFDLSLVPGLQRFTLESTKACVANIFIKEEGQLIPIPERDSIGGILLKNVPYGRARVEPEAGAEYQHQSLPETSLSGDLTPQGDVIFWLPPGYWQIIVDPISEQDIPLLKDLKAHLIPVFPGYLTEVNWPASVSRVFQENNDTRLEILKLGLKENQGFVDFSFLNLADAKIVPTPENLEVFEAGLPGKITSLERIKTPPEIVILLDSSGSMKNSMQNALLATAHFLKGLPPKSLVTLVDFDTKPKIVAQGTPQEVLSSLKKIKANGATALYDALKTGITLLKHANRPTLVLFTDGKDANWNDTGPGSKTTADETFSLLKGKQIPVFTIGFGQNPDTSTLTRLAALTGGAYYPASDVTALEKVFASIQQNLGNQWRAYYQRPSQIPFSNEPVLSIVVDNSGSMENRLEKVRNILADFVAKLPPQFLIQLVIFSDDVTVKQVFTRDKLSIYRALAEMEPLSGTEILGSLKASYRLLHAVPSSERYLLYLTDEALEVETDQKEKLKLVLEQLKDDGVKSLFVGMVSKEKEAPFKEAASLAAGAYVVSPDPLQLKVALDDLLKEIGRAPLVKEHPVRIIYKHTDQYGRTNLYSAATISNLPLPLGHSQKESLEIVSWKKAERIKPYGGELAAFVTGDDVIGRQAQVIKRLPLNIQASNKALNITLKEAIFLSKLRGVEPSSGRFLAITLKLKNILEPQEVVVYPDGSAHPASWLGKGTKNVRIEKKIPDYLIPDARLHFFLSWNNKTFFPVSDATYLAEKPLILPAENEILLRPGHPVEGTLIFVVPDEFMTQSALHLYDTAYGHIDLPLSGVLKIKREDTKNLPTKVEKKLSDTFILELNGFQDQKNIYELEAESGNTFRIVDLNLKSKVQAHLAIEPSKRFFLAVDTENGPFLFSLHPVTQRVPLGLFRSRLITPGSFNDFRLVFELPETLSKYPSRLLVDLKDGAPALYLKSPAERKEVKPLAIGHGERVTLHLNGIYQGSEGKEIVCDVTLLDQKDDTALLIGDFLALKATAEARKRFEKLNLELKRGLEKAKGLSNFGDNTIKISEGDIFPVNKDYLVTLVPEIFVINGEARRGFVFFSLPDGTSAADFVLISNIFKDFSYQLPAKLEPFPYESWLSRGTPYELSTDFEESLQNALAKLTLIRKAKGFVKPGSFKPAYVTIDGKSPKGIPTPPPSLLIAGGTSWENINDLSSLKEALGVLEVKASNARAWEVSYSPEAVFTQGWLTENEMAYMAEKVLSRRGFEVQRLALTLTDKGKNALKKYFSSSQISLYELPALKYEDQEGAMHTIVFPLFKELDGFQTFFDSVEEVGDKSLAFTLEVDVMARPISSGQMESLTQVTDALAGSHEETLERITLVSQKISLASASLGPLALGFLEIMEPGKGRVIKAILNTSQGRFVGDEALELAKFEPVQLVLRFYTPDETYQTVRDLREKEWPTEFFFVLGVNVPDLPTSNLEKAGAYWQKAYKEAKKPDVLSSLKWHGQGVIARFVGAQTVYEKELSDRLGVEILRFKNPRILVVGYRIDQKTGKLTTTLDIVQPYPEIRGEDSLQKRFNLLAGFYYSNLEAEALPQGLNAFKILALLPKETPLLLFSPDDHQELAEILRKAGYPRFVWEHIKETDNFVFFPEKPLIFDGNKMRVAWFEIDPESFRVWSFLDTGERGVVDTQIGEALALSMDYMMGFWMGVQNSVWATASFSLVLDDWHQIKTCAHGFARRLGSYLEAVTDPKGAAKPNISKIGAGISGNIPGMIGLSNFDYGCMGASEVQKLVKEHAENKAWRAKDLKQIVESSKSLFDLGNKSWGKAKDKYLGFANGYKDGVDWYFR